MHCYQAVTPIIDPTAPPNPISSSVSLPPSLPSPHYKHTIPCHLFREGEGKRASSVGLGLCHAMPATDGRTDGQAPRFLTAVITTSCHVQSHSWFWQPQSCRPYRCIFRCHESRRKVLDHQWFIFLEAESNFLHQCRYNYLVNVNKSTKGGR